MLQAMYNGVSALKSTQKGMDVIGNNISNVNTTGFKSSSVTFADQLSDTLKASSGPSKATGGENGQQIGLGVRIGSIDVNTNQGGLNATGESTDLAIEGNGYFMVTSDGGDTHYTRDGHLAIDSTGNMVLASTGEHILGWNADGEGKIDSTAKINGDSVLKIPVGSLTTAHATNSMQFTGNLNAASKAGTTVSSNITVYDSLGGKHQVVLNMTRDGAQQTAAANGATADTTPANSWTWSVSGDPALAAAVAGTAGGPNSTSTATSTGSNTGKVTFDEYGKVSSASGAIVLNPVGGAKVGQAIKVDMKDLTEIEGASNFESQYQDGYPIGTLQSFAVDKSGAISGVFSNGLTRNLGQISMATFSNAKGLTRIGANEFSTSMNSGDAVVSTANEQGAGSIASGYLEQSNVDLSTELTNMIIQQRSYQANTKIVSTVDELLDSLINMKH